MNISIRQHIINTFKDAKSNDIESSIEDAVKSDDEAVLPGLGVFFEILWKNNTPEDRNKIIETLIQNMI